MADAQDKDIFDILEERGQQLKTITGPLREAKTSPKPYTAVTPLDRTYVGMLYTSNQVVQKLVAEGKGEDDPEMVQAMSTNRRAQEALRKSGVFGNLRSTLLDEHQAMISKQIPKVGGELPLEDAE